LENVNFTNALGAYSGFYGATVRSVNFDAADLLYASFDTAKLQDVAFTNTNLISCTLGTFGLVPGEAFPADRCASPRTTLRLSRLANTSVSVTQIPPEVWPYLDLTDAQLDLSALAPGALALRNLCGDKLGG